MLIFFSRTGKTGVFAKILSEIKNCPVFELRCGLNDMPALRFALRAAWSAFMRRAEPVERMPESLPDELYVCAPVWGGRIASPARHFLLAAGLSGKKVNVLLTASVPADKYVRDAERLLGTLDCVPGVVRVFASGGAHLDEETIREHLKELM